MSTAEQRLASGPTRIKWGLLAVGFLAVMIDGFDTAALAASVPTIADDWGIPAGDFTYPLVLTNLGVVGTWSAGGSAPHSAAGSCLSAASPPARS